MIVFAYSVLIFNYVFLILLLFWCSIKLNSLKNYLFECKKERLLWPDFQWGSRSQGCMWPLYMIQPEGDSGPLHIIKEYRSSTATFSVMTELVVVGLWFHWGHGSSGISLYPWMWNVCHRVLACPLNRASDQWHGLAQGLFFMAVLLAGWLFTLHAASLQMDAGTAEATGLKIPSRSSSRPLHWEDEAHQFARGHRPNPSAPPSPPKPNLYPLLCPTSTLASIPPFHAFTEEDYKPNQPEYGVWPSGSVALAC